MRIAIEMQRLAPDMESGMILTWVKQPGDTVSAGDILVEVETDKVNAEMEAMDSGVLAEIVQDAGAEVAVGEVIAWLEP